MSNKEKCVTEALPWVTGHFGKTEIFNFKVQTFRLQLVFLRATTENFLRVETKNSCGKKRWISHQILRAVQFMRGWSAACDKGLKHGADDDAFHVLSCGFVVHRGEVISKPSLVWNAKAPIQGNVSIKLHRLRK